jgi:restriction system protein
LPQRDKMKTMTTDIGFLESIDTVLDFIVAEMVKNIQDYHELDSEDFDFIELNRFERANIILVNFQENRDSFINLNTSKQAEKLVELIYDSLIKSQIFSGISRSDLESFRENPIKEDEDDFLFNNNVFNWYDFSNFEDINRKMLVGYVKNILTKNIDSQIHTINTIDYVLYNELLNNPQLLRTLNWRLFEKLLADILERFQYDIELLKGTKDGGIDIIAIKKESPLGIHRYLIQAKRWQNKVGVEPVRSLVWAHNEYRVTKSCLATTSHFTRGAWELANNYKWQVELKDYEKLLEWIQLAKEIKT